MPEPTKSHPSTFDHVRCGTCGVPWTEHTADCPRHGYRPGASQAEAVRIPVDIVTAFDPEITQSIADLRRQAAARTAIELQRQDPSQEDR